MNEDFYKDSFEVYNTSVRQKLVILGFSPKIFIILTSVTAETFWGLNSGQVRMLGIVPRQFLSLIH